MLSQLYVSELLSVHLHFYSNSSMPNSKTVTPVCQFEYWAESEEEKYRLTSTCSTNTKHLRYSESPCGKKTFASAKGDGSGVVVDEELAQQGAEQLMLLAREALNMRLCFLSVVGSQRTHNQIFSEGPGR